MLLDLDNLDNDKHVTCDIAIVGGGAVGMAMAAALAKTDLNVIVLEGGGTALETGYQALQSGSSVGHPFENIDVGRYRVLGGTTTFWGGQVVPIGAFEMGPRPWILPNGWPLSYADLEPYFAHAYRLLGLGGAELSDRRVLQSVGIDQQLDGALQMRVTRWLPQRNFARLFQEDIEAAPNLRVIVHANVTAFRVDESRRRIVGLDVRSLCGRCLNVQPRATVLACGSLEIARLLLHPAADGGALPWQDNPWLGRGFIDHIHGPAADVEVQDRERFDDLFDFIYLNGLRYCPVIRLDPRVQTEQRTSDVIAQFLYDSDFSKSLDYLKLFLKSLKDGQVPHELAKLPSHAMSVARISAPLIWRYLRQSRSFKPRRSRVQLTIAAEQFPNASSVIRLGEARDALGMRRLAVDWRIDDREIHSIAVLARAVRTWLDGQKLARVHIDEDLERGSRNFLRNVHDGIHQMGTARMGGHASAGVVDPGLKVFDSDNLYVAGQAVFPASGFANPTFTGIALGLRLIDHLKAKLDRSPARPVTQRNYPVEALVPAAGFEPATP